MFEINLKNRLFSSSLSDTNSSSYSSTNMYLRFAESDMSSKNWNAASNDLFMARISLPSSDTTSYFKIMQLESDVNAKKREEYSTLDKLTGSAAIQAIGHLASPSVTLPLALAQTACHTFDSNICNTAINEVGKSINQSIGVVGSGLKGAGYLEQESDNLSALLRGNISQTEYDRRHNQISQSWQNDFGSVFTFG